MEQNLKTSKFLADCIENQNDTYIARLFADITKTKVVCIDIENGFFYKFNEKTLLYEFIGKKGFNIIVKNELDNYLSNVKKINTDKRLDKLLTYVLNTKTSQNVSMACMEQIYDKSFIDKLDNNTNEFHFANGYVDLKTGKFYTRTKDNFISKCNNYNYMTEKTPELMKAIEHLTGTMRKICNDNDDIFEFMQHFGGYTLTGENSEQLCLFLVGLSAGNGKSTLIDMFKLAFPNYTYKMNRESIEAGKSKVHKDLSNCKGIRLVYIEELENKINTSLFKEFVSSKYITNEVMYGTTEDIKITFKLVIISNYLFNANTDNGVKRRGMMVEFKNRFLETYHKDYKPNTPGIYVVDKQLLDRFESDVYKNALFQIYLPYAIKFYKEKGIKCKYMQEAKDSFEEVCEENDKMAKFIESTFTITKNDKDRIHKKTFEDLYKGFDKYVPTWTKLLSDAKRCGLSYSSDLRSMYEGNSLKNSFYGIKLRVRDDETENPLDNGVEIEKEDVDYERLFHNMEKQNEDLKHQIKELKRQLNRPNFYVELPDPVEEKKEHIVIKPKVNKSTKSTKSSKPKTIIDDGHTDNDIDEMEAIFIEAITK